MLLHHRRSAANAAPASRLRWVTPLFVAFLAVSTLTRVGLLAFNADGALFAPLRLLPALLLGLGYDTAVALWWCLPLVLLGWAWPADRARRALGIVVLVLAAGLLGTLAFVSVAEFVFWNEFASRFNFIAVDYLLYTREVVGNIRGSYALTPMFAGVGAASLVLLLTVAGPLRRAAAEAGPGLGRRSLQALAYVAGAAALTTALGTGWKDGLGQPQLVQLAGNGDWEFFHALRFNQIDYRRFYAMLPATTVEGVLQRRFVESLGGARGLTPNLERLAREGMFFTQMYATGTRTVRGLEALTLSVPPAPGHAIPMRPDNGGLFTLGVVLKAQGWEPLYVYGGYSYTVIDRSAIDKQDIHHETICGVADEDLFDLALREIDTRAAAGGKVFAHVMTTSNHRPYTYPAGRIDIPSGSGRAGAVKYSDFAIGRFVEKARERPWFGRTLFVFVADHTSIARGRSDLPLERFHIPMVVWAPGLVEPRRIDDLASQIDVAPTLLGLLNLGYESEFFGRDLLHDTDVPPALFMANYQTVGFVGGGEQVELRPQRGTRVIPLDGIASDARRERAALEAGIAYYQVAAERFATRRGPTPLPSQADVHF